MGTVARCNTRWRIMEYDDFNIPLELLPKEVATMVHLVGIRAAMAIVKTYGGRRLYVPRKANQDHPLVPLIGMEKFDALCRHYDGERLSIPKCEKAFNMHVRNLEIRAAYGPVSLSKLAARYSISERQVLRIVA